MPPFVTLTTRLPTDTDRRVWADPAAADKLVVLTATTLHRATLPADRLADAAADVRAGGPVEAALGAAGRAVELIGVERVRLDLRGNTIAVSHVGGLGTVTERLRLADAAAADEVFAALRERLGKGYEVAPTRPELWEALRLPLTVMVFVAGLTALAALGVSILQDLSKVHAAGPVRFDGPLGPHEHALPQSPVELIGHKLRGNLRPLDVVVLGGLAAVGVAAWAVRRVAAPPAAVTLARKP